MCHPAAYVSFAAASTLMQVKSAQDNASYQKSVMATKNQILEQEKNMKINQITRETEKAQSRAIAAGGMSGFMGGGTELQSALDFASEGGRAKYATQLRTSLEQGMNTAAGIQAGINAQTQTLGALFNFGKSVAFAGKSDWGFGGEEAGVDSAIEGVDDFSYFDNFA